MVEKILDAKGLQCPLPVLRANKMIKALEPGDLLRILATDDAAPKDFENYCAQTGHGLVESGRAEDGVYTIVVRKAG